MKVKIIGIWLISLTIKLSIKGLKLDYKTIFDKYLGVILIQLINIV